jgi:hypothetical protein
LQTALGIMAMRLLLEGCSVRTAERSAASKDTLLLNQEVAYLCLPERHRVSDSDLSQSEAEKQYARLMLGDWVALQNSASSRPRGGRHAM